MTQKQSVRAIIINDGKLLAMKRDKFGMQYYTLVGGGVNIGEDLETALRREIHEETGLQIGAVKLVFFEDDRGFYGAQYVYYCEYLGGEPLMPETSDEAKISAMGQNTYQPLWLPLSELPRAPFRSGSVAEAILDAVQHGFPETPRELAWKPEVMSK